MLPCRRGDPAARRSQLIRPLPGTRATAAAISAPRGFPARKSASRRARIAARRRSCRLLSRAGTRDDSWLRPNSSKYSAVASRLTDCFAAGAYHSISWIIAPAPDARIPSIRSKRQRSILSASNSPAGTLTRSQPSTVPSIHTGKRRPSAGSVAVDLSAPGLARGQAETQTPGRRGCIRKSAGWWLGASSSSTARS